MLFEQILERLYKNWVLEFSPSFEDIKGWII
jgi:hypothetical protein